MTEQTRLRNELMEAIKVDGYIKTRYEAMRFVYHYFKYYNKKYIPFWACDLVDDLYYNDHLLE